MARSFQKSQHATNYVIFKELVKSLPHLGQKATNLVVIVNKSLHDSLCVSSPYTSFLSCAHVCNRSTSKENKIQAYTKYLYLFCYLFGHCLRLFSGVHFDFDLFLAHTLQPFSRSLVNAPIPNAFHLFATYVLLAWPLCLHCVRLCYSILLKERTFS